MAMALFIKADVLLRKNEIEIKIFEGKRERERRLDDLSQSKKRSTCAKRQNNTRLCGPDSWWHVQFYPAFTHIFLLQGHGVHTRHPFPLLQYWAHHCGSDSWWHVQFYPALSHIILSQGHDVPITPYPITKLHMSLPRPSYLLRGPGPSHGEGPLL